MSEEAKEWFDKMTIGLREMLLRAREKEDIAKSVDATLEMFRMHQEAI